MVFEVVGGRKKPVQLILNPDGKIDKMSLRNMYEEAGDKLFDAAHKLFDWGKMGSVSINK
jgi:hypothetical protein